MPFKIILLFFLNFICWLIGLPIYIDIALLILSTFACVSLSTAKLILTTLFLLISFFAVNTVITDSSLRIGKYYRDHEMFINGARYRPLVDEVIKMPHGDLPTVDPTVPEKLKEPWSVRFKTDTLGFRNSYEFVNQKIILNGDSFVVANGTDQNDTLSIQLYKREIPNYSIAMPSDPIHYELRAREFISKNSLLMNSDYKFLTFFYEGNDFKSLDQNKDNTQTLSEKYFRISDSYDSFRVRSVQDILPIIQYTKIITGMRQRIERTYISSCPKTHNS